MQDIQSVTVLAARRAYEYRIDDIRLTYICTSPVQMLLQQRFRFHSVEIATPPPTFAPVPQTQPAGLVCQTGEWVSPNQQIIPIRYIYVEQFRIVIDIPATSQWLDLIFDEFIEALRALALSMEAPIIGEPVRRLDASEISFRFPVDLMLGIAPPLRDVITHSGVLQPDSEDMILIPQISILAIPRSTAVIGASTDYSTLTLSPRAGTPPDEHAYFSGATMSTDKHMDYLKQVSQTLARSK